MYLTYELKVASVYLINELIGASVKLMRYRKFRTAASSGSITGTPDEHSITYDLCGRC